MGQILYKTSHPFQIIHLKTNKWEANDRETVLDLKLSRILLMKKTKQPAAPAQKDKGFLALAGEAFHVLGEEILEGKDKVVEVASEKFTAVKKAIQKVTHKNTASTRGKVKKAVKKAAPKKVVKKAAPKKAVKKAAGKVTGTSRKVVKKTPPPKGRGKRRG